MQRIIIVFALIISMLGLCSAAEVNIIPQPKKMEKGNGNLHIAKNTNLKFQNGYGKDERISATQYEIEDILRSNIETSQTASMNSSITISLVVSGYPDTKEITETAGLKVPEKEEGYALKVFDGNITIAGADVKGLFYGMQTLKQILSAENGIVKIPYIYVEDYPSLKFRGIHFFTGKNALEEQKNLIKLMASWKMNSIVIEVDHMVFDSHPELKFIPFAETKEEIKELIRFANQNFIQVTPIVPSLCHVEYFFRSGNCLNIAEDPKTKYSYCPSNPESYKILFDLFDEVIDTFKPEYFHIGHDELNNLIKHNRCDKCRNYSLTQLMEMDLDKIGKYFENKNIKLMLWSDMFLYDSDVTDAANTDSPEEAKERRGILKNIKEKYNLPEIIITDWHYAAGTVYKTDARSLSLWKNEGFRAIASPFNIPENIRNFTIAADETQSFGTLQTTWAGYNFSIENNVKCHTQFSAYLLAAEYSWSARKELYNELPYDFEKTFWNSWYKTKYNKLLKPLEIKEMPVKSVINIMNHNITQKTYCLPDENKDREKLTVVIENTFTNPFNSQITIGTSFSNSFFTEIKTDSDKFSVTLAPLASDSKRSEFKVQRNSLHPLETMKISYDFSTKDIEIKNVGHELYPNLNYYSKKTDSAIVVDGNLDEWKTLIPYTFNDKSYTQLMKSWTKKDLSAKMYLQNDAANIYIAFEIEDDVYKTSDKADTLWNGDSIQIGLDFLNNKSPEYDADDFEMAISLVNKKPETYSWIPFATRHYSMTQKVKSAIINTNGKTVYEIQIPRNLIAEEYANSKALGFAIAVNDNDSTDFEGGMVSGKGMYEPKSPATFSTLILE